MASQSNLIRVKSLRKELEEKNLKFKEMDKTICEMQAKWLQENNHMKDEIEALNGYVETFRRLIQQGKCLIKTQVNHLNNLDEMEGLNGDVEDCLQHIEGLLKFVENCLKDVECLSKDFDEKNSK